MISPFEWHNATKTIYFHCFYADVFVCTADHKNQQKKRHKKKTIIFLLLAKNIKTTKDNTKKKKKILPRRAYRWRNFFKKKKKNTRGVMQTMLLTFQVSKSDLMWNLYDVKDMEEVFYVKPPKLGFKPFIEKGNMNSIGP